MTGMPRWYKLWNQQAHRASCTKVAWAVRVWQLSKQHMKKGSNASVSAATKCVWVVCAVAHGQQTCCQPSVCVCCNCWTGIHARTESCVYINISTSVNCAKPCRPKRADKTLGQSWVTAGCFKMHWKIVLLPHGFFACAGFICWHLVFCAACGLVGAQV